MNKEEKNKIPKLRFPYFKDEGWNYLNGDKLFEPISNKEHNSDLPILAITQEHGAIPREQIEYHVSVTDKSVENYKVVEVGDFIISLRSFQGGIEYSAYKGLCSPAYIILRKKNETEIINNFYKHYFKTRIFIRDLNKNIEGIRDGKMVSYQQFSELLIPLPKPIEQQKIAECLSSLDDLITAENQKLETLKAHKKGLMQQLFPAESETAPRLRFKEFMGSEEWEEKTLAEAGKFIGGGTPDTSKPEYWNGTIQWFTPTEIKERNVSKSIRTITEKGLQNSSAKLLPKGTLLITTRATIGDISIASEQCSTNQGFQSLIVNDSEINVFWYYWITQNKNELKHKASGSTFPEIGKNEIVKIKVLRPEKNEQKKIADCLSSLDELITAQAEKIETLKQHKKGLMQGLFPIANDI